MNGTTNDGELTLSKILGNSVGEGKHARRQGLYWMLTIPAHDFMPYLPPCCQWIIGQLEKGGETGYVHWQILAHFKKKVSLRGVKQVFGQTVHAELTISEQGSEDYVWKDDTCLDERFRFELGKKKIKRNSEKDWNRIREQAIQGNLSEIDADVYIRYYRSLRQISTDHLRPVRGERRTRVFWGETGTGKSHTAWDQAGESAYSKSPRDLWWDAYEGQENVVIDEFRGGIPIEDMLRWLDPWPKLVQTKGGHRNLRVRRIWITSNLSPEAWYPCLDTATINALMRRLEVYHFTQLGQEFDFDNGF